MTISIKKMVYIGSRWKAFKLYNLSLYELPNHSHYPFFTKGKIDIKFSLRNSHEDLNSLRLFLIVWIEYRRTFRKAKFHKSSHLYRFLFQNNDCTNMMQIVFKMPLAFHQLTLNSVLFGLLNTILQVADSQLRIKRRSSMFYHLLKQHCHWKYDLRQNKPSSHM